MTGPYKLYQLIASAFILVVMTMSSLDVFAIEYPTKPTEDVFVIDEANMISDADKQIINAISLQLRNQKSIPIVVVTLESLAHYDAKDLSIEAYSRAIFDHWEIGRSKYNYGMLLVVSQKDRKARIELGSDWAGAGNKDAIYIMDNIIIKRFRADRFSEGVREGVLAMDGMARGHELPDPFAPPGLMIFILVFGGLAVIGLCAIGISLIKSGRKGRGWMALVVAATILMFLLRMIFSSSSSSGGFSKGGFSGGGSSSGVGATGSW